MATGEMNRRKRTSRTPDRSWIPPNQMFTPLEPGEACQARGDICNCDGKYTLKCLLCCRLYHPKCAGFTIERDFKTFKCAECITAPVLYTRPTASVSNAVPDQPTVKKNNDPQTKETEETSQKSKRDTSIGKNCKITYAKMSKLQNIVSFPQRSGIKKENSDVKFGTSLSASYLYCSQETKLSTSVKEVMSDCFIESEVIISPSRNEGNSLNEDCSGETKPASLVNNGKPNCSIKSEVILSPSRNECKYINPVCSGEIKPTSPVNTGTSDCSIESVVALSPAINTDCTREIKPASQVNEGNCYIESENSSLRNSADSSREKKPVSSVCFGDSDSKSAVNLPSASVSNDDRSDEVKPGQLATFGNIVSEINGNKILGSVSEPVSYSSTSDCNSECEKKLMNEECSSEFKSGTEVSTTCSVEIPSASSMTDSNDVNSFEIKPGQQAIGNIISEINGKKSFESENKPVAQSSTSDCNAECNKELSILLPKCDDNSSSELKSGVPLSEDGTTCTIEIISDSPGSDINASCSRETKFGNN